MDDDVEASVEALRENLRQSSTELLAHEVYWREKQPFLASQGYSLRPRYHPDWIPSWTHFPQSYPMEFEDYWQSPPYKSNTDATRDSDGKRVNIKKVMVSTSNELEIARYFSQDEVRNDPRNHCIPILDWFPDDVDDRVAYIVMPFLRDMADPPFDAVEDVIDFTDQVLEGLVFMHEHYVAHRDAAFTNILMDADPLYPNGFHPVLQDRLPDISRSAWPYSRQGAPRPVTYYFADFGMSSRHPPGSSRFVTGRLGADREAPELSDTIPYDAFKLDIFTIGNMFRKQFYMQYFRVEFLTPLIEVMTRRNPESRPDARQALAYWRKIRRRISPVLRVQRLRYPDEVIFLAFVLDILFLFKMVFFFLRRFARWFAGWLVLVLRRARHARRRLS